MAINDIFNGLEMVSMDKEKNYKIGKDGILTEILDLSSLGDSDVGFIGHKSSFHKAGLADRNFSVLQEIKADKTAVYTQTEIDAMIDELITQIASLGV